MKNVILKSIISILALTWIISACSLDDPQHGMIAWIICFVSTILLSIFAYANGLLGKFEV